MGVTSASDNLSPQPPSFNPKHVSLHLCLPSPHCWDLGQPSPAVKPSKPSPLKKKNTFVQTQLTSVSSRAPDNPCLRTQACSAWQRLDSPEYGLNAKDHVHVSVNLSFSAVNMGYSNTCIWMASQLYRLVKQYNKKG